MSQIQRSLGISGRPGRMLLLLRGLDEAYLSFVSLWERCHELPDRLEHTDKLGIVLSEFAFQRCELSTELFLGR